MEVVFVGIESVPFESVGRPKVGSRSIGVKDLGVELSCDFDATGFCQLRR